LQLVKPGKGAVANTAIKLDPTKNKKPIQSNPVVRGSATIGSKTTQPVLRPLAPGLNLVNRTGNKKQLPTKNSKQNALPNLPEGDASGTVTAQFIPIPSADDVVDFVEDKAQDAGGAIGNAAETIGDVISDGAEELGGAISDGAEEIGDAIDEAGDNFGGPVDELGGAFGNVGKELGGTIGNTGREAGDFIRENGNKAGEQIQDGAKWGADKGRDVIDRGEMLADEIKQRGQDIANDARERGEELANEAEEALNDAREDANDAIDQFQDDFLGHDSDRRDPGNGGTDPQEDSRQENNPPANGNDNVDNGTPPVQNEEQPTDEVEQPVGDEPAPEPNDQEDAQEDQFEEEQEYQDDEQYEEEYVDENDGNCVLPPIQIWLPGLRTVVRETVIVHTPAPAPIANFETAVVTEEEEEAAELPQVPVGATLELAGQDLGQEAGQVLLKMGVLSLPAKVEAWNETITITLPSFGLAEPIVAELHIIRANGEMDTAVAIELVPALPVTDQE
jgi:hypothetical protein